MSSLTERLEAHAQRHDEFYPPDEEQTQWASDLREAIEAVRERDELARQRGELAARVIELQAHIDSIRIGARAVVAHWDEFGPEHGFDEAIDVLRRQLGALAAKVIEPLEAMGGAPREADAQRMGEVGGSVCEGERLAFEAWMRGHCWTPTPTHTAVPHVQATAPERIYLVIGEDVDPDTHFDDLGRGMDSDGVTWCADKIDDNSIPYVRADLASLPAPQGEQPPALGGDDFETWWRSAGFTGDLTHMIAAKFAAHRAWCAVLASQDSRTPTVAPGGQPLSRPNSQDGDSVLPTVEPSGATLSPCAASTAITPAIADALAKARVFALCALRRDGYRFTFHDEAERWAELLLESVDKATPQVDRGESSSPSVAASE